MSALRHSSGRSQLQARTRSVLGVRGQAPTLLAAGPFFPTSNGPHSEFDRIAAYNGIRWMHVPELPFDQDAFSSMAMVFYTQLPGQSAAAPDMYPRLLAGGARTSSLFGHESTLQVLTQSGWEAFAGGVYHDDGYCDVKAICEFQGDLYVAGWFTHCGAPPGEPGTVECWGGIARWDGNQWHALDNAMFNAFSGGGGASTFGPYVGSLLAYHLDSEPVLYVGFVWPRTVRTWFGGSGQSGQTDSIPTSSIAYWDGQAWGALPGTIPGVHGSTDKGSHVQAMCIYDDKLIIAGVFDQAGDFTVIPGPPPIPSGVVNIAGFDPGDETWYALNGGLPGEDLEEGVHDVISFKGRLFAGGNFPSASPLREWVNGAWVVRAGGEALPSVRKLLHHVVAGRHRMVIATTRNAPGSASEDSIVWFDEHDQSVNAFHELLTTPTTGHGTWVETAHSSELIRQQYPDLHAVS